MSINIMLVSKKFLNSQGCSIGFEPGVLHLIFRKEIIKNRINYD